MNLKVVLNRGSLFLFKLNFNEKSEEDLVLLHKGEFD
jgi:hypothetical protein